MKKLRFMVSLALFGLAAVLAGAPINWDRAPEPYPGIKYVKLSTNRPRPLRISYIRVDLTIPGLRFTSTERDRNWGAPMPNAPGDFVRTRREPTPAYMVRCRTAPNRGGRGVNMLVAANATPWTPWPAPKGNQHANPAGLVISDGQLVVDNPQNRFPALLVLYRDGQLAITPELMPEDYPKVWMALTGFGIILKDGKPVDGGGYEKELMPRMSYGITQDRRYLILMAIDGRQPGVSEGTKGDETAQFLLRAGAWDGIDMDGGGSATLCYWERRKGRPEVLSSTGPKNYCREVGMNMGIFVVPQPPPPRK